MSVNPTNTPQDTNIYTPKDKYTLRILGAEYVPENSKKNPMFKLDCEIIGPDAVTLGQKRGGGTVDPRGQRVPYFITLTEKAMRFALKNLQQIGINTDELDLDNPDMTLFNDKEFNAIVVCEEVLQFNEAGEEITDSEGKSLVRYRRNIAELVP